MAGVATYLLVCLATCQTGVDSSGNPIIVGTNTVVNAILWDGTTPYTPPYGQRIIPNDGTPIGGVTAN